MKTTILVISTILIILFSAQDRLLSQPCMDPAGPISPQTHISVDPPVFIIHPTNGTNCSFVTFGIQPFGLCPIVFTFQPQIFATVNPGDSCTLLNNWGWNTYFSLNVSYCWATHTQGFGVTWSNMMGSEIKRLSASLPLVSLITPINGTILIYDQPFMDWSKIDSASSYEVRIYTEVCCINCILDSTTNFDSLTISTRRLSIDTRYYWKVKPYKAGGEGPFSDPFYFTTVAPLPPQPPNLLTPPDNSVGLPLADTLKWDASAGASSYRLVVATDEFLFYRIVDDSTITGNSQYITGLNPLTRYWWAVSAKNAGGSGNFPIPFMFKTMGAPGIPTALVPPDNAIDQPVSLTFQWSRTFDQTVSAAAKYWFELYTDTSGSAVIRDSALTDTARTVSGLLNNQSYWWRVKAMNVVGWGEFSSYSRFTTIAAVPPPPTLISPANNSAGNPVSLPLIWYRSANAFSYRVQLSSDSLFNTLLVNDSTLTDSTRIVSGLTNLTNYWWRVNAKNAGGISSYSTVFKFTTIIAAPTAPVLVSPANNSTNIPTSLTLIWNKTLNAVSYRFQLASDSLFNTLIVNDSTLTDSTRIVSGLSNLTNYWWRVNAKNAGGISSYSTIFKFTTIIAAPTAPVLVSPANNAINVPTSLTFIWNKTLNSVSYKFQLASDSLFSALIVNDSTLIDSTRIVSGLSNLTNYWWRVNAKNAGGISSFSTTFKFTTVIAAPLAPVLISPANNSVGNLTTLTLVWNKSTNALNYRVQLSSDSLFNTLVVNDSTLTDSTRVVSGLNPLSNYWWRVNAKNAGGSSAYSAVYKFKTLGVPAQLTGIFIPPNGAIDQPLTVDFKWSRAFDQTLRKNTNTPNKFNSETILNYWFELTTDSVSLAGIIRDSLLTDTNKTLGGFDYATSYYWRVKAKNQIGWGSFSFWQKFTTAPPLPATVTLKVIPGGFFNPVTGTLRMRDTINVYLVDSATCLRVDSNRVVLDSVTFSASLSFSNAPTGNYYLYIYHRNHLPVASMYSQSIVRGANVSYDLTTDSTKAYGFNLIEVSSSPDRWGMIPGDANRDEFVDGLDQTIWINQNGFDGYLLPDFNGDGLVDGLDQTIWIKNNGASSYLPCMTPYLDVSFEKLRRILERELQFRNDNIKKDGNLK